MGILWTHSQTFQKKVRFFGEKNHLDPRRSFFFDRRLAWEAGVAMLPPPFLAGRSQGEISEDLSNEKRPPGLVGLYRG